MVLILICLFPSKSTIPYILHMSWHFTPEPTLHNQHPVPPSPQLHSFSIELHSRRIFYGLDACERSPTCRGGDDNAHHASVQDNVLVLSFFLEDLAWLKAEHCANYEIGENTTSAEIETHLLHFLTDLPAHLRASGYNYGAHHDEDVHVSITTLLAQMSLSSNSHRRAARPTCLRRIVTGSSQNHP
jgi:hypothetical protein